TDGSGNALRSLRTRQALQSHGADGALRPLRTLQALNSLLALIFECYFEFRLMTGKRGLLAVEGEGTGLRGQGKGDAVVGQRATDPALHQSRHIDEHKLIQAGSGD